MSALRHRQPDESDRVNSEMLLEHEDQPNIKGDEWNICILFILYLLQGIPLGLTSAIPMLLQTRGASFKQQAEFSFVNWPFSIKLLWAPIVDSLYSPRFGRRKTWMVPAQYIIGFFMIFLSSSVEKWLGNIEKKEEPQIFTITALFFFLNFLAATQDIAVDGWALTMLKRRNVGYASVCNSAGQSAGYFLGYVVFIALESKEFCNKYLRTEPQHEGVVTFTGFLYFWGIIYVSVTTLIALFKRERNDANTENSIESVTHSYFELIKMFKLKPIKIFIVFLLTAKIGFAACDAATGLKLVEKGIPKEKLAIIAIPLVPLQVVLPIIISRFDTFGRPLDLYSKVFPYRLLFNLVAAFLVYTTSFLLYDNKDIPIYYYVLLLIFLALQQTTMYCMFVNSMMFYSRISDPALGGTYMTLLNAVTNLGGTWSSTVALSLVDPLTWKYCSNDSYNDCSTVVLAEACLKSEGNCTTFIDGYYFETILCTIFGFIWYRYGKRTIRYLQTRPLEEWRLNSR